MSFKIDVLSPARNEYADLWVGKEFKPHIMFCPIRFTHNSNVLYRTEDYPVCFLDELCRSVYELPKGRKTYAGFTDNAVCLRLRLQNNKNVLVDCYWESGGRRDTPGRMLFSAISMAYADLIQSTTSAVDRFLKEFLKNAPEARTHPSLTEYLLRSRAKLCARPEGDKGKR